MSGVKTLVLDIGGIFFYPAWRLEGVVATAKLLAVAESDFKQALQKNKKPFYTGTMSEREYWKGVLATLEIRGVTAEDMAASYRTYVRPIPETVQLLPELAAKYTLLACNNSPKEWMDYRIALANLNHFFEKFFTSGYVGAMKPDDAMYVRAFAGNPHEIAYIDDDAEYVQTAQKKFAVSAYGYTSVEDLLRWIR